MATRPLAAKRRGCCRARPQLGLGANPHGRTQAPPVAMNALKSHPPLLLCEACVGHQILIIVVVEIEALLIGRAPLKVLHPDHCAIHELLRARCEDCLCLLGLAHHQEAQPGGAQARGVLASAHAQCRRLHARVGNQNGLDVAVPRVVVLQQVRRCEPEAVDLPDDENAGGVNLDERPEVHTQRLAVLCGAAVVHVPIHCAQLAASISRVKTPPGSTWNLWFLAASCNGHLPLGSCG
mmetsp:Transcript_25335/g.69130  ORF Transcript_25335/g.69130 Transcript_25335/m.69130 type:complete len:237 (+) Transcript_25335:150-860(+)